MRKVSVTVQYNEEKLSTIKICMEQGESEGAVMQMQPMSHRRSPCVERFNQSRESIGRTEKSTNRGIVAEVIYR